MRIERNLIGFLIGNLTLNNARVTRLELVLFIIISHLIFRGLLSVWGSARDKLEQTVSITLHRYPKKVATQSSSCANEYQRVTISDNEYHLKNPKKAIFEAKMSNLCNKKGPFGQFVYKK